MRRTNAAASWIVPTTFAQCVKHTSRVRALSSVSSPSSVSCIDAGQTFLTAFGEDSEVSSHMAWALDSLGRYKEAEAQFRRGIEAEHSAYRATELDFALFLRQRGRNDEVDGLALRVIDAVEDKFLHNPDNCWLRSMLGQAYGLVGDLNRMRQEESRVQRDCGDGPLALFQEGERILGEKKRYIEILNLSFRAGTIDACHGGPNPAPDSRVADWPGYRELLADETAECKRLDALY